MCWIFFGDNWRTNKAFEKTSRCGFICFESHRYNLAAKDAIGSMIYLLLASKRSWKNQGIWSCQRGFEDTQTSSRRRKTPRGGVPSFKCWKYFRKFDSSLRYWCWKTPTKRTPNRVRIRLLIQFLIFKFLLIMSQKHFNVMIWRWHRSLNF